MRNRKSKKGNVQQGMYLATWDDDESSSAYDDTTDDDDDDTTTTDDDRRHQDTKVETVVSDDDDDKSLESSPKQNQRNESEDIPTMMKATTAARDHQTKKKSTETTTDKEDLKNKAVPNSPSYSKVDEANKLSSSSIQELQNVLVEGNSDQVLPHAVISKEDVQDRTSALNTTKEKAEPEQRIAVQGSFQGCRRQVSDEANEPPSPSSVLAQEEETTSLLHVVDTQTKDTLLAVCYNHQKKESTDITTDKEDLKKKASPNSPSDPKVVEANKSSPSIQTLNDVLVKGPPSNNSGQALPHVVKPKESVQDRTTDLDTTEEKAKPEPRIAVQDSFQGCRRRQAVTDASSNVSNEARETPSSPSPVPAQEEETTSLLDGVDTLTRNAPSDQQPSPSPVLAQEEETTSLLDSVDAHTRNASAPTTPSDQPPEPTPSDADTSFEIGDHVYHRCSFAGIPWVYQTHGIVSKVQHMDGETHLTIVDFSKVMPNATADDSNSNNTSGNHQQANTNTRDPPNQCEPVEQTCTASSLEWHKVVYEASMWQRSFYRAGTCTVLSSDPSTIVMARVSFLLENMHLIPKYHHLKSNDECLAVWCKTGVFQAVSKRGAATAVAPATAAGASLLPVTVPAAGFMGAIGFTTQVPLFMAQPLLLPAAVITIAVLHHAKQAWKRTTTKLNEEFWNYIKNEPEVFAECIDYVIARSMGGVENV